MNQNLIEKNLIENIHKLNCYFVFPTQTAADLWADRITLVSDVSAVAMERFMAWDTFKGNSIKSKLQSKKAIPSIMRQMFTDQLISQNGITPVLKNLIMPEYAASATGFTNWISSILPGLATWKKYFDQAGKSPDTEDEDLLYIYGEYKAFLDKHDLFDPAWETPPFEADGNHYIIFFPEILSDYNEYEPILKDSSDITIVTLPENEDRIKTGAEFYPNTRIELTALAMKLLDLHKNKNIPWDEIAVNVPDMDTDGVYIHRELELLQIPHVMRYAKPLTSSGAGNFFIQLSECYNQKFNFESIKNLILNTELPWREPGLNSQLIEFGQKNNCICSFNYNGEQIDIWEKSFSEALTQNRLYNYYRSLKEYTTKIVTAKTFDAVREAYFIFREKLFNMDECPAKTDLIISRCISELGNLIDIQKDFPDCIIKSPFMFFINHLNNTKYLEQADTRGVQILPYRTAASAPFSVHLVIDSSQSGLSVVYKPLSFLRDDKRKMLFGNKEDPNVTEKFIRLYEMNSMGEPAYFSVAAKTFSGYAQLSSYLSNPCTQRNPYALSMEKLDALEQQFNSYKQETQWFLDDSINFPSALTKFQYEGFNFWADSQNSSSKGDNSTPIDTIKNRIKSTRFTEDFLRISASSLKDFYECPRLWFIKSVCNLQQQDNEAVLMDVFAMGNLYHKILELYFEDHLKNNNKICLEDEHQLSQKNIALLETFTDKAINTLDISFLGKEQLRTIRSYILEVIIQAVTVISKKFHGFNVAACENKYDIKDSKNKFLYTGRIDLLLQNPISKDYTLIDFKKSKGSIPGNLYFDDTTDDENSDENPEDLMEQELPDFQMPLYILLLSKNEEKPIEVKNCAFFNITDAVFTPVAGNFDDTQFGPKEIAKCKTMEDFDMDIQKVLEFVHYYAQRIENLDFSTNRKIQNFSCCNGCDLRAFCRNVFNVSRKD